MDQPRVDQAFQHLAEKIQRGAESLGLTVPQFKTPPSLVGVARTISRHRQSQKSLPKNSHLPDNPNNSPSPSSEPNRPPNAKPHFEFTVAVAVKGRLTSAIMADMIEGVCVVNDLTGAKAQDAKTCLWKSATAPVIEQHIPMKCNNYIPRSIKDSQPLKAA